MAELTPPRISRAKTQYEQIENIRTTLRAVWEDHSLTQDVRDHMRFMADIIEIWQERAYGFDPTDCALSFGSPELTVTLRQVLSLLPDQYQALIILDGSDALGFLGGSWLDGNVMDVLIHLSVEKAAPGAYFAPGIATDCNMALDALSIEQGYPTRMAHLKAQLEEGSSDPNAIGFWNASGLYTVPADTNRIVCFWNYHENHWTVLCIEIDDTNWTYKTFNSLAHTMEDTVLSIHKLGPDLGFLIRAASHMEEPPDKPELQIGECAQQENYYDCGIYALDNAIHLLSQKEVPSTIDDFKLRFSFIRKILHALRAGEGINSNNNLIDIGNSK